KFTPDHDGDFLVRIRDQLHLGGPQFVYRIEVTPAQPSLSLKTPEVARNDTQSRQYVAVPRGNRYAMLVNVKRANFNGDLSFDIRDLPAGTRLLAEPMPSKVDSFPIVFEAATDAPVTGRLLDLVARNTDN